MCGIAGIVSRHTIHPETVHDMTNAVSHRGPDAQGIFISDSGKVALGHTRLSIIDLSAAANQPMVSADKRLVIVFNGEIYNYREIRKEIQIASPATLFNTQSDTETILAAFSLWGTDMVDKLEGMFALAIHNLADDRLYLFRDRLGKKPIYYYRDDEHFIFASEIKSLLKHPVIRSNSPVDRSAVQRFLHLGYVPAPASIYTTIRKFPAGHIGTVDEHLELHIRPYWEIDKQLSDVRIDSGSQAIGGLRNVLTTAVRRRLVSDVPVGTFLSGGTDSSLVTAIASQYATGPLKTFNIGFVDQKFDERPYAAKVARHLGTDHEELVLTEQRAMEVVDEYVRHFDEPFADTSAIPTMLVSKLAREKVKVVLTGDGGDELFLGYGAYDWSERLSNPLLAGIKGPLRFGLNRFGNNRLQRIAHMFEDVPPTQLRSHIFSQEQYLFSARELSSGLNGPLDAFEYTDPPVNLSPGEQQAIFDMKYYLPDDLLVKVDRASMACSLECRCPLLDHDVVEFALRLDKSMKIRKGERKWILKKLLEDFLPPHLVYRRKWGFSIPLGEWLSRDMKYMIDQNLSVQSVEEAGIFKPDFVSGVVKAFLSGRKYMYNRVWALVVIHKWIRENHNR